jgi:hypothetical protein
MIKPLALLRQCEHVRAGITNGAEHPAVLGREGVGREPLIEIVGGEDHVRSYGMSPNGTHTLTTRLPMANGRQCMAYVRECVRLDVLVFLIRQPVGRLTCNESFALNLITPFVCADFPASGSSWLLRRRLP